MTSAPGAQGVSAPHQGNKSGWSTAAHWHGDITTPQSPADLPDDWDGTALPSRRVQEASNSFILGEKQNEREGGGISRDQKAPKTCFQLCPSTPDRHGPDARLREWEPLQNLTPVYPGLLRCCRTLRFKFECTFYPPSPLALLLENVPLTRSFHQRSSPRPLLSPLPLTILIFYYFSLEETCK